MKTPILTLAAVALLASSANAADRKTMYQYVGYEAAFWPVNLPVKPENYSKIELDSILRFPAKIDTVVMAASFGFASIPAKLQSADFVKHQPSQESRFLKGKKNGMPGLVAAGSDPIMETSKWCRKNKKEFIVSLPVNHTHAHNTKPDSTKSPVTGWYSYLYPSFKLQHPELTMNGGDQKTSTPYANPTAMDYGKDAVGSKFSSIACEIVSKYDIDGLMIDFMMHTPVIFATVAKGGVAEPKEVAKLTAMMQKIKAACQSASARLGHKVTFSVRVPDSVGYCKDIGIDLAGWMDAKMFDFVVFGGRFQLNPWKVTGDFMAKYGVPYYADFALTGIYVGNDSGYHGDDERLPRMSRDAAAHRAQIAEAILGGAAGCVYTQGIHHEVLMRPESLATFDEKANRLGDKRYFTTYTNTRLAGGALKDGMKHATVDVLLSSSPDDLSKGIAKHKVYVWDDFAALKRDGITPKVTLITEATIPSGMDTIVTFNGKELKPFKKRSGTQLYDVPLMLVKTGANEVTAKSKGKNKRGNTATFGNVAVEVTFPKPEAKKEAAK